MSKNYLLKCVKSSFFNQQESRVTMLKCHEDDDHTCVSSLRANSHMSQEPWSCNGEDPWLSSKGCTMGVGKAALCNHGPSSIVWSENGPCCGNIACLVGRKRRWFDKICFKLYQFKINIWWCLSTLEFVLESALPSVVKYVMLENIFKNSWSPIICIRPTSWSWPWRKFR